MPLKLSLALAALSVTLALVASSALAGPRGTADEPGVTPTSILLGGTAPKTGAAAAQAAIATGAAAYFAYVNRQGGVNGRRIDYVVRDDAGDPAQTLQQTQQLVEQANVFAIFNTVGTDASLAVRDYLDRKQVPQLFAASGATALGTDSDRYPLTIGFRPSYTAEGWVLGQYVARTGGAARVAVLFEAGDYGTELLRGFRSGIVRSKAKVVAAQPFAVDATDVRSQMERLRASGANVLAVFADARITTQAFRVASTLGWKPTRTVESVAASPAGVLARSQGKQVPSIAKGTISIAFLKDPSDPRWVKDAGMRLYRTVLRRYAPGADPADVRYVYGMASAWAAVEAIRRAGSDLTRKSLAHVVGTLALRGDPFLLPGIALETGPDDHSPIDQMLLQRWRNGVWHSFGGLWQYRG